jgi:hypothetical protein
VRYALIVLFAFDLLVSVNSVKIEPETMKQSTKKPSSLEQDLRSSSGPYRVTPPPWFPRRHYGKATDIMVDDNMMTVVANDDELHRRGRRLSDFENINSVCQDNDVSIEFGPSTIFKNLTDPSVYDMRKRPNTAPVIQGPFKGRPVTTEQDNVTFAVMLSSVDAVNMKNEEVVMRWVNIGNERTILFSIYFFCSPSPVLCMYAQTS